MATETQPRIQIATVDIRVLKIGSKQMTQAVFNQLETAPLIDPDTGLLTGEPWGWINYKADSDSHRRFVFEAKSKLYQSQIHLKGPKIPRDYNSDGDRSALDRLVESGSQLAWRLATQRLLHGEITNESGWYKVAAFTAAGRQWNGNYDHGHHQSWLYAEAPAKGFDEGFPLVYALLSIYKDLEGSPGRVEEITRRPVDQYFTETKRQAELNAHLASVDRLGRWLVALQANYMGGDELDADIRKQIAAVQRAIETLLKNWTASLKMLEGCDQLFIAV